MNIYVRGGTTSAIRVNTPSTKHKRSERNGESHRSTSDDSHDGAFTLSIKFSDFVPLECALFAGAAYSLRSDSVIEMSTHSGGSSLTSDTR